MSASSTSWDWLNLPENSSPANTKTFLIHSFGRPVLIAARSGERRGTSGSPASSLPASAGTVGCSEVIVSIREIPPGQTYCRPAGHIETRQGSVGGRHPLRQASPWAASSDRPRDRDDLEALEAAQG